MKLSFFGVAGLVAWTLPSVMAVATPAPSYECGCGDVCYGRTPTTLGPAPTSAPSKSPTRSPIQIDQRGTTASPTCDLSQIDVCIAIDMSGSVCSYHDAIQSCSGCPSSCDRNTAIQSTTCCDNYVDTLAFAEAFIDTVGDDNDFAVVSFSTFARPDTHGHLETGTQAKQVINSLTYTGGLTNTGQAIEYCRGSLANSQNQKAIVLLSDGEPTTGATDGDHHQFARNEANIAKGLGITIVPVTILTGDTNTTYMAELGSGPEYAVNVGDFGELSDAVDEIVELVQCAPEPQTTIVPRSFTAAPTDCPPVDIDVCIAVDTSGSICSPQNAIQSCSTCKTTPGHVCHTDGADECCENYHTEKQYAGAIATDLGIHAGNNNVSVVLFSTDSDIVENLMDPYDAGDVLRDLEYIGGLTATADAITHCHETLQNSTKEKIMVLLTDGTPTTCDGCGAGGANTWQHYGLATRAANLAKGDDIRIIPIVVNTGSTNTYFLRTIASDLSEVQEVSTFTGLADTLGPVIDSVQCGAARSASSDWYLYSSWSFYCGDTYMYDSSGPWTCRCLNDCECKYSSNWGSSNMHSINDNAGMRIRSNGNEATLAMIDIPTYSSTKMKVVFDFVADGVGSQSGDGGHVDQFVLEWASSHTFLGDPCVVATYECCGTGDRQFQNGVGNHKEVEFDFTAGCGAGGSMHNRVVQHENLAGAAGEVLTGSWTVDYDISFLSVTISGGPDYVGDADLYVRKGSPPTTGTFDCRPYYGGNSGETCVYEDSDATQATYYWMIRGWTAFSDVDIEVVTDGDPPHMDDLDISIRFRTINSHNADEIYIYNTEVYLLDDSATVV